MHRVVAIMSVVGTLTAGPALAQEVAPGPATVEVALIPGGATFFTSKDAGPERRWTPTAGRWHSTSICMLVSREKRAAPLELRKI